MKPGIYYNMSFEDYQAIDAINCSKLVAFNKTPAHALVEKDDTPGMRLGRAIHAALLEHDRFKKEWVAMPEGMKRMGKKWDDFQAEHKDSQIISGSEMGSITGIIKSLQSGYYETARKLIELCDASEVTLVWIDRKWGCLCKARLDLLALELGAIIDLKSSTTSDPQQWLKTAINAQGKPHFQPHWYLTGAKETIETEVNTFIWILVEVKEPFGISVIQATPVPEGERDIVYLAGLEIDPILAKYLTCKATNKFPGRQDQVVYADLPDWYWAKSLKEDF